MISLGCYRFIQNVITGYIKKTSWERTRVTEIFPININIENLHAIQG